MNDTAVSSQFEVTPSFEAQLVGIQRRLGMLHLNPPESLQVMQKDDGKAFATRMDSLIEETLKTQLKERFPNFGFLGEETESTGDDARYRWVVDPIDGTSLYALGGEYYSNSIALADRLEGKILFSLVLQPSRRRQFMRSTALGESRVVVMERIESPSLVASLFPDYVNWVGHRPRPSTTKALPEMEVCAFGTNKHCDNMPGIKDRLKRIYMKETFSAFKREYGCIEARPGSGSSALYISDIADGRKHAALLFFQAAWDMAAAAPYARDAGCIVKCDTRDNPDIASWNEDIETVVSRCGKTDLLNVAVFANQDVEREVLRKYNV